MTRLLFVIDSFSAWGPAEQLFQLARRLSAQTDLAIEIQIVVLQAVELPAWTTQNPFDVISLNRQKYTHSKFALSSSDAPISRKNLQSVLALRDIVRDWQPDIVHAWGGNSAWVNQIAANLPRFKLPGRQHRDDFSVPIFNTELQLPPKQRIAQRWYEQKFGSPFVATIVPHATARNHLLRRNFSGRIEIIPNRIEPASCEVNEVEREAARQSLRKQLNLPPTAKIAGTFAPLIPRTRLKDLIWATDLLTCVRNDFHLLILGNGTQQSRLRRFASLTEAEKHVHFLNDPIEPRTLLNGLDFYWHSHLMEPLPTVLLTAMASEIPVLSVYGQGTQEIIRHQATGFAVNLGARDEFARWTKFLIEQSQPARQLAQQGQAFVAENFTDNSQVDHYRRVWGLA